MTPEIFAVSSPEYGSDYESIRVNGLCNSVKVGDETAELYSPNVAEFLWSGGPLGRVRFLVRDDVLQALRVARMTGLEAFPVKVAKIATKGLRTNNDTGRGEPEDLIMKAKNVLTSIESPPVLWGINVTAVKHADRSLDDVLDPANEATFNLQGNPEADLFRVEFPGGHFGKFVFCGQKFKDLTDRSGYSNIRFRLPRKWILDRRRSSFGTRR